MTGNRFHAGVEKVTSQIGERSLTFSLCSRASR